MFSHAAFGGEGAAADMAARLAAVPGEVLAESRLAAQCQPAARHRTEEGPGVGPWSRPAAIHRVCNRPAHKADYRPVLGMLREGGHWGREKGLHFTSRAFRCVDYLLRNLLSSQVYVTAKHPQASDPNNG